MKEEKFSCRECGAKLAIKEIEKIKDNICPICNKRTSWSSGLKATGCFKELFDEIKDKI